MVKKVYAEDILWQTLYDLKMMLESKQKTDKIIEYLKKQIEKTESNSNSWVKIIK